MQSTRVDEGGIIDISVVIPVYNEAENIRFLAEEIVQALANESCEIIFVDDGSDDDSESVFNSIADADAAGKEMPLFWAKTTGC